MEQHVCCAASLAVLGRIVLATDCATSQENVTYTAGTYSLKVASTPDQVAAVTNQALCDRTSS